MNLDHTTIAALQGDGIFDAMTGVPANLTLPPPGFGGSYRHHMGRAMGALRHIVIDTSTPYVTKVSQQDKLYPAG